MSEETHARLLEALAGLNRLGAGINRIGPADRAGMEAMLRLVVENVVQVVPGTSAVLYAYDPERQEVEHGSRVSAGARADELRLAEPRPDGLGARAILRRRRVLSPEEPEVPLHPQVQGVACLVACFPLLVAERVMGILYVYRHDGPCFSDLELAMLDNLTNQAAMAMYHVRRLETVEQDLARREDELARLRRAGLLISSHLRLEEMLQAILQMALEVTGAHYGIFRLVDKASRTLVTRAVSGEGLSRPLVEALPINATSVTGWVAQTRQPLCIADLREPPWCRVYYPLDYDLEMRSELAVPLIGAGGRLEGVLNLESPRVGGFGEQDSHLLQALATQAVIAIQEARLLDALQEVAGRLLAESGDHVMARLAELACDLLDGVAAAVWVLEGDDLSLRTASAGHPPDERIPLRGSLTGLAITHRAPVTAEDVRTDPRFHRQDVARELGWGRALIVPVLASGEREPVGAFGVYSAATDSPRPPESEWDQKVLTCLAHYAALVVHNEARQRVLKAAQEQRAVAETFAAIGDMAANLLHQLNNRVGTIPVRVQGIQDKCAPTLAADPYLAANLAAIERSAGEAMRSVRDNLFHLRPIEPVPVSVAQCVAVALAAADLPEGVNVRAEGLERLPPVLAAERSLAFVFSNLLENAADAMGGEGEATITGRLLDERVVLSVADSGPGIPAELHERIFELDYSGHQARPGKLGFGLWWVKTLMARLGGSVSVESDGQHGTVFRLDLPRVGGSA